MVSFFLFVGRECAFLDYPLGRREAPAQGRMPGIRQCRPKCRPINLPGGQIFADLNSAKVRIFFGADSC